VRESGIVAGLDFSPHQARILLMLALTTTTDIAAIQLLTGGSDWRNPRAVRADRP
jgi:L-asparaginase/Glu-tRNA(Gln) amidotransferase subunit D